MLHDYELKEGSSILRKYFTNYKWTDTFWILFILIANFLSTNNYLYHLTKQDFSEEGCILAIPLFLFHFLFIDKFIISRRNQKDNEPLTLASVRVFFLLYFYGKIVLIKCLHFTQSYKNVRLKSLL